MQKKTSKFVDLDNARVDEQRRVMSEIVSQQHCPFCPENLQKYHKQPIVKEGKYWLLTKNQWPYEHTKLHFLIIYKEHVESLSEVKPEAGTELIEFCQFLEKKYKIPGGGVCMRFGDTEHSAGTVLHLHAQFIVPDIESVTYEPVRFKIGKSKEKLRSN